MQLPCVAATLRIAKRGCLKHVDAAMLIAWMEKIEKHKRNTRFADPEPLVAMASHSLMSPVLLNLCGTIERESVVLGSRNTTIIRCRAATAWVRFSIDVDFMFVRFSLDFR